MAGARGNHIRVKVLPNSSIYETYVKPPSSLEASEALFSPLRRADGVLHGPSTEIEKLFPGADSGRLLMSTATYPPICVDTRTCQSRTVFYVGMPMREDKDGEGICNTKRNALAADLEICVGIPPGWVHFGVIANHGLEWHVPKMGIKWLSTQRHGPEVQGSTAISVSAAAS